MPFGSSCLGKSAAKKTRYFSARSVSPFSATLCSIAVVVVWSFRKFVTKQLPPLIRTFLHGVCVQRIWLLLLPQIRQACLAFNSVLKNDSKDERA